MYKTKEEIINFLIIMDIENYVINEDLTINVYGDVYLSRKLSKLPIQFNIINGNFNCSYGSFTNLQGFPKVVNGNFACNNNQLISLEYCPEVVNGNFNCDNNQLNNLKGCPREVNGNFSCNNNNLTSLEDCPRVVYGDFNCNNNELTSFKNFYTQIEGLKLSLSGNNIQEEELSNFNCNIDYIQTIYSDFNKDGNKEDFIEKVNYYKKIKKENELLKELINESSNNIKLNKKL